MTFLIHDLKFQIDNSMSKELKDCTWTARSVSHLADLTPGFPLTSAPGCPHLPRRGPRNCGSSSCGPAFASSRGRLVSKEVSGLHTAATAAQLPLQPLSRCRRLVIPSPPSGPFRLSPSPPRVPAERARDDPALGPRPRLPSPVWTSGSYVCRVVPTPDSVPYPAPPSTRCPALPCLINRMEMDIMEYQGLGSRRHLPQVQAVRV
ncbi:PREDICTED: leucine-rich repeat extensin-like protein 3 [Hipposideros armiger]|uniref:Leucine-rich repeat extensin-like protein 3 n=1 Tax=Hipposideros armiger TaxID=186990 RepID=A0A8B7RZ49_HIPAR|nr:PREDICTED: leucine-rich repeat extensin-like protein 3 [Hipposideros armiger]